MVMVSQVQQRGVDASVSIVEQLLADVDILPKQPVLLVDALPNRLVEIQKRVGMKLLLEVLKRVDPLQILLEHLPRFSEWSFAAWEFQRRFLTDPENCTFDLSFLGVYHEDDQKTLTSCKESVAGKVVSGWWDSSSEAGPPTRPQSTFEEEPPTLEVLSVVGKDLKIL